MESRPILTAPAPGPGQHSSWDFVDRAPVLDALALHAGMVALDVGCGRGEWARAIATQVAPGGTVLALDVWTQALRALAGTPGIYPLRADARRPLPLRTASVDRVLCALVLHHLSAADRAMLLGEFARLLRPGGVTVLVEFAPVPPPPGPPLARRLDRHVLRTEIAGAGLAVINTLAVAGHVDAWIVQHA